MENKKREEGLQRLKKNNHLNNYRCMRTCLVLENITTMHDCQEADILYLWSVGHGSVCGTCVIFLTSLSLKQQKDNKISFLLPLLLHLLLEMERETTASPGRREEGRKGESSPTLSRRVPTYWDFSGRTGALQYIAKCFVWSHCCLSVSPQSFNCWREMRYDS